MSSPPPPRSPASARRRESTSPADNGEGGARPPAFPFSFVPSHTVSCWEHHPPTRASGEAPGCHDLGLPPHAAETIDAPGGGRQTRRPRRAASSLAGRRYRTSVRPRIRPLSACACGHCRRGGRHPSSPRNHGTAEAVPAPSTWRRRPAGSHVGGGRLATGCRGVQ